MRKETVWVAVAGDHDSGTPGVDLAKLRLGVGYKLGPRVIERQVVALGVAEPVEAFGQQRVAELCLAVRVVIAA